MSKKKLEDYTEAEFLAFITKIFKADFETEKQGRDAVLEFKRLTEHPDGSDVIYYPPVGAEDSPQGILERVKQWRAENGKLLFKK
ncbi:colicin immunity protein [Xenorhabdus khoisanae]|uniref:Colicin immunity protein n=1 Tax=Xenorhabdus khoisanae TaxID=880157 RepID=A0A0J5FRR9_9GAMM|nr:bacteriocin immunity protein [Xenorhabdus khoisanae]KMJ44789.1 colicin immunity protein [Xenorhabdus khoisanae]